MSASNYLENKLVDFLFRGMAFTPPTHIFLSLHSADPGDTGASELTGGGYGRVDVGASAYNIWKSTQGTSANEASSGTGGQTSNVNALAFAAATADWATATHFGLWDSLTTGNFLTGAALSAPKTVQNGDTPSFAADVLTVTIA